MRLLHCPQLLTMMSTVLLLLQPCCCQQLDSVTLLCDSDRSAIYALDDTSLAYKLVDPQLSISVSQSLSTPTVDAMLSTSIDFGVVLASLSSADAAASASLRLVPLLITGLVPVYNLPSLSGSSSPPLVLPQAVLSRIFTGSVTQWNDSAIAAANPSLSLPSLPITVVIESGPSARNLIIKTALISFWPAAANSSLTQTEADDFPIARYAAAILVEPSLTTLVAAVLATPGALGLAYYTTALALDAQIASMQNRAAVVVQPGPSAFKFAAVELGTQQLPGLTSVADLTDASGPSAWPLTLFSYLVLDLQQSRTSCQAREDLVDFLLFFYQSDAAASLLASRGYAAVPDLVMEQLNVISLLSSSVLCWGELALPPTVNQQRFIGVSTSIGLVAELLVASYQDSNSAWTTRPMPEALLVDALVHSEVDAVLLNLDDVDSATLQQLRDSEEYYIFPLFAMAISWFANPVLTAALTLQPPTASSFVMDVDLMNGIFLFCLRSWTDERLLSLNPWLAEQLQEVNAASLPPIFPIFGCGGLENAPLALSYYVQYYLPTINSSADAPCGQQAPSNAQLAEFYYCLQPADGAALFVPNEQTTPAIALGIDGAFSLTIVDGDTDKLYPVLTGIEGRSDLVSSDIDGILACFFDSFDQAGLSFSPLQSVNDSCWPMVQQVAAVVRRSYYSSVLVTNASSCTRGLDALQLLHWLFTTTYSDGLTNAVNIARLVNVPSALPAYLSTLNWVLCDSSTLFITLPVQWSLNSGLTAFAYVACSAGLLHCLVTLVFLLRYRQQAVVRATSPLFQAITLLGVVLLYLSVLMQLLPASDAVCQALQWLVIMGLCLTFAPLFAKSYRIYRIFGRKRLAVVKVSDRRLLGITAALCSAELLLLVVWHAVAPLSPQLDAEQAASGLVTDYVQCGTRTTLETAFLVAAGLSNGLLLLVCVYMSISTRSVSSQFNESSQQALAIYNVVFTLSVIIAVLVAVDAEGDVLTGVLVLATLWIALFTVSILNVPQMLKVLRGKPDIAGAAAGARVGSNSEGEATADGFSFVAVDVFTSMPMMMGYQRALQAQLHLVEARLAAMRGKLSGPANGSNRVLPSLTGIVSPPTAVRSIIQRDSMHGIGSPPAVSIRSIGREISTVRAGLSRHSSDAERPHPGGQWVAPVVDEALPDNQRETSRSERRHRRARSAVGLKLTLPLPTPLVQPASAQ